MTPDRAQLADSVLAPPTPGRLGVPIDPTAALTYLDHLGRWRDARRRELEQLDQAALSLNARHNTADVTADIMLSMALWKAVADRYEMLASTWDSGRAGPSERERMASLIWGRLDPTIDPGVIGASSAVPGSSPLAVSVPEACRLSDALAAQLRVRLGLATSGQQTAARIHQLRAQLERIRDQVGLEPAGAGQQAAARQQAQLARRLAEISDKAGRGGDVGGLLCPLEIQASTFERDLIVNGARRREAGALVRRARSQLAELNAREDRLRELATRCVQTVTPAPRYAVPDLDALGPVPNTTERLQSFTARLDQVARAITVAENAYTAALADHAELVARLDAYHSEAVRRGLADRGDVAQAYALAGRALSERPCRMELAAQLVTLYRTYLQLESA